MADGVNVGYDVYLIETDITQQGAALKAKEWVDHRDRQTRKKRWSQTEDDTPYTGKELDRSVVNLSQIRQVIQAMKNAVETHIFPTRTETPKTLIFAKTDSHADDIINILREVYGQGNAFCKKVTYKAEEDTDSILSNFRNDYHPRIAVTVDMIATGTDVKPLEVLLFMRDVRSKGYYEQMKGRGVRSLDGDSLKRVSNSADGAKTRFVLIDAVGVEQSLKTESRPLEKKPGVALKDLLQGVAMGSRDDDTVLTLANRLVRLAKQLDDKAKTRIEKASGGIPVAELGIQCALTATQSVASGEDPNDHGNVWRELKDGLAGLLHDKCWYCESPVDRSDNAVDHFRPKNRVSDAANLHAGYRWLAFDRSNFRYACTYCNCRRKDVDGGTAGGKADRFPLLNEPQRVYAAGSVTLELPLLLDPCEISALCRDQWVAEAQREMSKSSFPAMR